jgi:hypothetical protein
MRRAKRFGSLKYLIVAVIAAAAASAFFLLHRGAQDTPPPHPQKQQTGYKAEDRKKLEQLIHQGAKDD